jgi:hypothetical protein
MALSGNTKGKRDKLSAFGQWMEEKAVSQGTSLQEISQYIGQDYAVVSRLSAGTKTPTYETAMQIGEMVDDVTGALMAAGFVPPPNPTTVAVPPIPVNPVRRMLASGDEIILSSEDTDPEDTLRRTEAFLLALRKERAQAK